MILKDLGEFRLIDRIARHIKLSSRSIKGIGDDTAVLRYTEKKYLLFTCDMLIEGRHFLRTSGGYLIGKKSLSASISDIAAMGGEPRFFLVSLGVPASLNLKYVDCIYRGIRDVAKKFNVDLVGGDTVSSGNIIVNIALLGEVEKNKLVLRSGAKEGDEIFITGFIGGAAEGRHLTFSPRLKEARYLARNFKIHSMIDVSDGLVADLGHILGSSKLGAVIYERDIPISKSAKNFKSAIKEGEDFELVFTMSRGEGKRLTASWPFSTRLSKIGEVCRRRKGMSLVRKNGKKESMIPGGYTHF
ncbi:MAG: thiamine-phosphate kinase [Candidatus Omnitrophica bacterium]|nr:thiamine-phosphate kinase [Candidatus Omnitrophota bacterium]